LKKEKEVYDFNYVPLRRKYPHTIGERLEIRSMRDRSVKYKMKARLTWGNLLSIVKSIIQRLKKGKTDEFFPYRAYSLKKLKRYFK
jgi:hypothetical protein